VDVAQQVVVNVITIVLNVLILTILKLLIGFME
jgi:hypothetical protein